jgi:hypothetical protein
MEAYLIVDVDDLQARLKARNLSLDFYEVASTLRNGATVAAGLREAEELTAIAVADWNRQRAMAARSSPGVEQIFVTAGYEIFNIPERAFISDTLQVHYFSQNVPLDELIVVSTQPDVINIYQRIQLNTGGRIRVWSDEEIREENLIFQPLRTVLGIPTKTVAMYIDFENITIGLNEQGYIIDLDQLIESVLRQARAHGQVTHLAAYAPWGQRGSLPPLVDAQGREISDDAPSRLALSNIDPVFNLPGKNSADMRIAKDILTESTSPNSAEVFVIASGDRDFNDVFGALRARGKQVVVWGIHGSTSRILENNPAILLEYLDDFARFQRHTDLSQMYEDATIDAHGEPLVFHPSQWSSLVLQYDMLASKHPRSPLHIDDLTDQLVEVHTVTSPARSEELIAQAEGLDLLSVNVDGTVRLNDRHPITVTTRIIRDRIVHRVTNTLNVRNWDYVNYGFLLKGIGMDPDLDRPGLNLDDNWRSEWIDALVRDGILARELVAHRQNPDDLVPVIMLPSDNPTSITSTIDPASDSSDDTLENESEAIDEMKVRIIVSVEQFTSFRGFIWCPLGSLHKRLRPFDPGTTFQQAVEVLMAEEAVEIDEYQNPQSDFKTKGISLDTDSPRVKEVLEQRDEFVKQLLELYQQHAPITREAIQEKSGMEDETLDVWISIMQLENVLNLVPGHEDLFSLFRTHHTVNIIAEKYGFE